MKKNIFLSHVGQTKDFIVRLADYLENLEESNLKCWYAPRDIPTGNSYSSKIVDVIGEIDIILVYITDQFPAENYVTDEVALGRNEKKRFFPILHATKDYPKELKLHLTSFQALSLDGFESELQMFEEIKNGLLLQLAQKENADEIDAFAKKNGVTNGQGIPGFIRIEDEIVNTYIHKFVPTPISKQFDAKEPLLYFYGGARSGKTMHAIHYFKSQQITQIYEAVDAAQLQKITNYHLPKKSGLIVRLAHNEQFNIPSTQLLKVQKHLREHDSKLIVCGMLPTQICPPYEIKLPDDKYAILLHTLKHQFGDCFDRVEKYVNAIEGLLQPTDLQKMADIDSYVLQIQSALEFQLDVQTFKNNILFIKNDLLQNSILKLHVTETFYLLAASINQQRSYKQFYNNYLEICELYKKLFPQEEIINTHLSMSDVLERFNLKLYDGSSYDNLGRFEEKKLLFVIPELEKSIWSTIWAQYPKLHEMMQQYLLTLLHSKKKYYVHEAKENLLHLLTENFHEHQKILTQLIKTGKYEDRLIVRDILLALSEDIRLNHKVLILIRNWIETEDTRFIDTVLLTIESTFGIKNVSDLTEILILNVLAHEERIDAIMRCTASINRFSYHFEELDNLLYELLREMLKVAYRETKDQDIPLLYYILLIGFSDIFYYQPVIYFKSRYEDKEKLLTMICVELIRFGFHKEVTNLMRCFIKYTRKHSEHKKAGQSLYLAIQQKSKDQDLHLKFGLIENALRGGVL